jgi:hydroxymethylglutaryl-CoA reductase (NADPH)
MGGHSKGGSTVPRIPRDADNDYTREAAERRLAFVREQTGTPMPHTGHYSIDPDVLRGNIEHFSGVVQMPLGFAGPLLVNGEHAQGEFYVPMATTEGTLVASYNRGMRLTREAGGITTTVVDDAMQRAPVFLFRDAREARAFGAWVNEHFEDIKAAAETTTRSGKLRDIEHYPASRMLYLRFNYTTGDAAGQNMCGKATLAACHWIQQNYRPGEKLEYYLSGNMDTDKKHSAVNAMHCRGKKVVAEITIPDALLRERMRVSAEQLFATRRVSQFGSLIAGAVYNGVHPANGIASVFIATGQDEANVAGIPRGLHLRRGHALRRLLLLHHPAVPDRRHLRRRHGPAHAEGVPGGPGLLRPGQGPQARRDRRGDGAVRGTLPGRGGGGRGVGVEPRAVRPQPLTAPRRIRRGRPQAARRRTRRQPSGGRVTPKRASVCASVSRGWSPAKA